MVYASPSLVHRALLLLSLTLVSACDDASPVTLEPTARIESESPIFNIGRKVAGAGDVDGDGAEDLLILAGDYVAYDTPAPGHATSLGRVVSLVNGPLSGTSSVQDSTALIRSPSADLQLVEVGPAGDVNGDGIADIFVEAWANYIYDEAGDIAGDQYGPVYVFYGPLSGEHDVDAADAQLLLDDTSSRAREVPVSVARAGDVDRDGVDDLVLAGFTNDGSGMGALFTGPLQDTRPLSSASATFEGATLTGHIGDLNGDGYDDVLVGSELDGVAIFYGPVSGEYGLEHADVRITGIDLVYSIQAFSGAGDLDGDSKPDLMVTVRRTTNYLVGYCLEFDVLLFLGPRGTRSLSWPDARLTSDLEYPYVTAAPAGDVDGDSFDDLILGRRFHEPDTLLNVGGTLFDAAYLFYGPPLGDQPIDAAAAFFAPPDASRGAGAAVSGVGDLDGDGYPDLVVGAEYAGLETTTGAVFLISGGPRIAR